jgi:hypothetical protein
MEHWDTIKENTQPVRTGYSAKAIDNALNRDFARTAFENKKRLDPM